jgi:hypothetical protein
LYSLKAASRIDLKFEDGVDVWPGVDEDMELATVSFVSDDSRIERVERETRGVVLWFGCDASHCLV